MGAPPEDLVRSGVLRHQRRGLVRGLGLVELQHQEQLGLSERGCCALGGVKNGWGVFCFFFYRWCGGGGWCAARAVPGCRRGHVFCPWSDCNGGGDGATSLSAVT